jgi:hypothetical protein
MAEFVERYGHDDARDYIVKRTGFAPVVVEQFLDARFRHAILNEVADVGEQLNNHRERHADLITINAEGIDADLLLRYIKRNTGIGRAHLASMIAEETAYDVSKGLTSPEAYEECRAWADAIAQAEAETESRETIH